MKLVLSSLEASELIKQRLLSPISGDSYTFNPARLDRIGELTVSIEYTKEDVAAADLTVASVSILTEQFNEILAVFPKDDVITGFVKTRDLLVDKTNPAESNVQKYAELIKTHGFTHEQIVSAIEHEVNWRVRASISTGKNKLTFMKGLNNWLSDISNIRVQLQDISLGKEGVSSSNIDNGRVTRTL